MHTDTINEVKREILIHNYIQSLKLTSLQLQQIYSLAITYQRKKKPFDKKYYKAELKIKMAFAGIKESLLKGESPSEKTRKKTIELQHRLKDMRQEFQEVLRYYQDEIQGILTKQQQDLSKKNPSIIRFQNENEINNCFPIRHKKKGIIKIKSHFPTGQKNELRGLRFFMKVRRLDETKFEKTKERLFSLRIAWLKKKMGNGITQKEIETEKEIFENVLEKVRHLEEREIQKNGRRLLNEFRYRGLDKMTADLVKIRSKWSKQNNVENNLGKYLLRDDCIPVLKKLISNYGHR